MISCKMITAGRVHLLEEALYSFLTQDYLGEKELIIVNDYPYQTLIFDHSQVKIINKKELFPSIGEKDTFAHELCQGDIIAVYDDDDVALPNHLDNIRKYFIDTDLLHWQNAGLYYESPSGTYKDKPNIQFTSVGNSGIVYSHKAYNEAGKSPLMNEAGDRYLVQNITKLRNKVVYAHPENKDISWLYRWSVPIHNGVGCYHQSGLGDPVPGRDNAMIRNFKYLEKLRKQGMLPVGNIYLKPQWKHNYVKLLKQFL